MASRNSLLAFGGTRGCAIWRKRLPRYGAWVRFVSNQVSIRFQQLLEEKGLAERQLADGRAREQSLGLTAKGKALVPQLAALADANDAHFFDHLPEAERDALTQAMQAMVQYHQLKEMLTA